MTISGVPNAIGHAGILPGTRPRDTEQAPVREAPPQAAPAQIQPTPPEARGGVPVEAPAGTDPALWQVLTPEERSFFARARTMGPLTYGPGSGSDPNVPDVLQGGRIDVRV